MIPHPKPLESVDAVEGKFRPMGETPSTTFANEMLCSRKIEFKEYPCGILHKYSGFVVQPLLASFMQDHPWIILVTVHTGFEECVLFQAMFTMLPITGNK